MYCTVILWELFDNSYDFFSPNSGTKLQKHTRKKQKEDINTLLTFVFSLPS